MTDSLVTLAEAGRYQELFIQHLHWNRPDHPPITVLAEGRELTVENVSSYKGLRVWVCQGLPGGVSERLVDREIAETSTDRLVIFHDAGEQIWRWPARSRAQGSTAVRLTRHRHRTGTNADQGLARRLKAIELPTDRAEEASVVLARLREAFDVEAQNETKYASKLMARMYAAMQRAYPAGVGEKQQQHEISVTLARLLFLMFGDDTEMWPADLFANWVALHTAADGSDIAPQLKALFDVLNQDEKQRHGVPAELRAFRYVNGGIFKETITLPPVDVEFRDLILEACSRDWSTISPAIFGSMFQSVRDAETRRAMGEHYTSEENILKTLNPLFLDELRDDFTRARDSTNEKQALQRLRERLGEIRFLDPACGCGNFIIVAYRELRDLELQILERLQALQEERDRALNFAKPGARRRTGDADPTLVANLDLRVHLDHFHGIELDEWPARIAETAMFLIDRQCDLKLRERLGEAPDRLPIREQASIVVDNALRIDWAQVCEPGDNVVIAGNPPFVGMSRMTDSQQDDRTRAFAEIDSKGLRTGRMDYVAGWYAKAISYVRGTEARAAFVSTNSLAQGEQARTVGPLLQRFGFKIDFAHRTFRWTTEAPGAGAKVHVVIVGISQGGRLKKRLYHYPDVDGQPIATTASNINSYLVEGPDELPGKRRVPLLPDLPVATTGSKPWDNGGLSADPEEAALLRADPAIAPFLRRYYGATELLSDEERWCLWLERAPQSVLKSPLLTERFERVVTLRAESATPRARESAATPWLFNERRQPDEPYFGLPQTSSARRRYIPGRFFAPNEVVSNGVLIWPNPPMWLVAYLQSRAFVTWQEIFTGRLKSDFQLAVGTSYMVFPFVRPTDDARERIDDAIADIFACRKRHGTSLARLYDGARLPTDLAELHRRLDEEIDSLYGMQRPTEEERFERLMQEYYRLA